MSSDAEILSPRAEAGARSGPADPRRWAALVVMLLAAFMNLIDQLTVKPGPGVFATAVEHALWFQVGVFGLAFLLMLALPARRGHNTGSASV